MRNRETDISLIRKYLSGELDAKAMHRLERRAQDDPFLMDALEGYEISGNDQQKQLKVLSSRLNQRVTRRAIRIIPLRTLGIAASVLIICSAGVWWLNNARLNNNHLPNKPKLAIAVKPPEKTTDADTLKAISPGKRVTASLNKKPYSTLESQKIAASDNAGETLKSVPAVEADKIANVNIKDSVPTDTTPLNEAIVMEYSTQKKKDVTKSVAAAPDSNRNRRLQAKVAGVDVNTSSAPHSANAAILQATVPALAMNEMLMRNKAGDFSKRLITGRVVAKDDGVPLPGVSVKVAGTNIATQTDANGRFNLAVDSSRKTLVVGYIGYQSLRINTNNRDSIKNIVLAPSNNSLNEVSVTGYSTKNNDETTVIAAHPRAGWSSFRKYLKEKAISPDGKIGVVRLSFEVDHNGIISDIKVEKGLRKATDQKAIDLLTDGPDWVGSTSGKTEKVTLRVKFVK